MLKLLLPFQVQRPSWDCSAQPAACRGPARNYRYLMEVSSSPWLHSHADASLQRFGHFCVLWSSLHLALLGAAASPWGCFGMYFVCAVVVPCPFPCPCKKWSESFSSITLYSSGPVDEIQGTGPAWGKLWSAPWTHGILFPSTLHPAVCRATGKHLEFLKHISNNDWMWDTLFLDILCVILNY